jgi:hypothetical protein
MDTQNEKKNTYIENEQNKPHFCKYRFLNRSYIKKRKGALNNCTKALFWLCGLETNEHLYLPS